MADKLRRRRALHHHPAIVRLGHDLARIPSPRGRRDAVRPALGRRDPHRCILEDVERSVAQSNDHDPARVPAPLLSGACRRAGRGIDPDHDPIKLPSPLGEGWNTAPLDQLPRPQTSLNVMEQHAVELLRAYAPPVKHLSKDLTVSSPGNLGQLAYSYLEALVDEAEQRP